MKILLVEDEKDFLKIFNYLSKKYGFELEYAEFISSAKEILQSTRIDLAVIDYTLPDGNGFQLNHYIKTHYKNTKTLLSTGHTEMVENQNNENFDYYVKKDQIIPFMANFFSG